jgi:glutamate-1-semialdehyde 2,1-aminomutase
MAGMQADLVRRAGEAIPGGSLGTFFPAEGQEFVVVRGQGARVWDAAGREYVDYILGSGPMVLGHAHPAVVAAVKAQLERGSSFYALNEPAVLLAEKIRASAPCAEQVKFCSSGSEANFFALRIARAATRRDKILKFEGAYHGHFDAVLMSTWPGRLPNESYPAAMPDSAGIPQSLRADVLVAPFNDLERTAEIVRAHRDDLAAIIIEPQSRLVDPQPGFLEGLRRLADETGALLIFDEVVMGFRVARGGAQELYGVVPDLACYGKVIGGGYPLAAVAGARALMQLCNPRNKGAADYAYMSGTLNGNAVAATAGLATLTELEKPGAYDRLRAIGERMRAGLRRAAANAGVAAQVLGTGPMANIYFTALPITDYRSQATHDAAQGKAVGRELLKRGFLTHLVTKIYLSLAHSDADIDRTTEAVEEILTEGVR